MLGLIAKVLLFIALIAGGAIVALNATDAATWGTISVSQPAIGPCHAYAERMETKPVVIQVRWVWTVTEYGWGCYFEYGDDSKGTVTPMPDGNGTLRAD